MTDVSDRSKAVVAVETFMAAWPQVLETLDAQEAAAEKQLREEREQHAATVAELRVKLDKASALAQKHLAMLLEVSKVIRNDVAECDAAHVALPDPEGARAAKRWRAVPGGRREPSSGREATTALSVAAAPPSLSSDAAPPVA